ncbi:MAG: glycosyltransferase [Candidatus Micrarchaeia archaeon]
MNIAFFTDTYLPNTDGVVTLLLNYTRELEKRGHEVFIFSPGTQKQKEENKDPHIYYFTSKSFKPYPDYRIAVFNFFSPIQLMKDLKIDVIHSHGVATTGLAAIQSSKKLGIPAISTFHTLLPEAMHYLTNQPQLKGMLQNVAWGYLSWYYSQFKKTTVPSDFTRKILETHKVTNTVLLPGGVDSTRFNDSVSGEAARKKYGIKKNVPVVLHLGRVALEKNIGMLIDSAPNVINLVPDVIFMIAGKGPAENYYKDIVKQKGLDGHFVFTGYVENELLPSVYACADTLAFPSSFDTQGLVVLEAMACGTPAVVRKGSAPSEFVIDGVNGQVFSDHFDFHEKIISALKNKEKLEPNAVKTAKEFGIDIMTERLIDLYSSLLPPQKK